MTQYLNTQLDITKHIQWDGEGLLTTPANFGALTNPTYANIGIDPVWSFKYLPETEDIWRVGDPARDSKTKTFMSGILDFRTHINDANGLAFLKWLFNEGNKATLGTVDESIDVAFAYNVGNPAVEHFVRGRGCMPLSATLNIPAKGIVELSGQLFIADAVLPSITTHIGTGAWAGASSGKGWTNFESGSNPFLFNGTSYYTQGFSVTVQRELTPLAPSGESKTLWAKPTVKNISGSIDVFQKDILLLTDAVNQAERSMSRVIKSAVTTCSLTNVAFDDYPIDIPEGGSTSALMDKLSFTAKTIAFS